MCGVATADHRPLKISSARIAVFGNMPDLSDTIKYLVFARPLHELGSSGDSGCGQSDGRSITISSCDAIQNNGVIYVKKFGMSN